MRKKIPFTYILFYLAGVLFFLLILPFLATRLSPGFMAPEPPQAPNIALPETVRLYITEEDRYQTIPFEDYIAGVVASEMPSSFEPEALKAQSVASRTYALGRIQSGTQLCDTVHCQVYRNHDIPDAVRQAVKDTAGQVLLYDGKLATQTLYFSSSAGDTENAEDVFANPYPYLVSVSSSYEPNATHKKEKQTMTVKAFAKKLRNTYPNFEFGAIKKKNIKILSHTKGGRVKELQVGDAALSGTQLRTALDLYSTRFSITFRGKKIIITSSGSGHGVGMSQYGANGLAKWGRSYIQILKHYYKGVDVVTGDS